MPTQPLIPTRYVNAPSSVVYNADLSAALFQTYVRLRGLAWQSKTDETPPLTIIELAEICHIKRSSMWNHLKALKAKTDLRWITIPGYRMILQFDPVDESPYGVQTFGHLEEKGVESPEGVQDFGQQGVQTFGHLENLKALATYGVDVSEEYSQQVAMLEHVTPELVHAWAEQLQNTPGVRTLPGLLLYKLRTNMLPPPAEERRGGARPSMTNAPPEDTAGVALPDDLRAQLDRLGLRGKGPRREVTQAWKADPERVEGWVRHVLRNKEIGVGLFLTMIREGEPAPEDPLADCYRAVQDAPFEPAPEPTEHERVWREILDQLELEMTQATFNTWLRDTRALSGDDGVLVVEVRNDFAQEWLDVRLRPTIERVARHVAGCPQEVQFVVGSDPAGERGADE
jgi:hypothetical protein